MFIWYLFPYVIRIPGLILGILIGWQVVRRIVRRGYLLFGLATGLFIVFLMFITIQYSLVLFYRSSFSQTGPCGICGEWTYVPFSLLWLNSALMLASGTVTSIIAIWKTPPEVRDFLWRWPKWFPRLLIGLLASIAVAVIAILLFFLQQQATLVTELSQISDPIEGPDMRLIGRIPLPGTYPPSLISMEPPYIQTGGLTYSPDGRWFSASYREKLEIWDAVNLNIKLSLQKDNVSWRANALFSPDGELLAIYSVDKQNSESRQDETSGGMAHTVVYSTDNLTKLWEIFDQETFEIFFSPDNQELIQLQRDNLQHLDAKTGTIISRQTNPSKYLSSSIISPNSKHIMFWVNEKIQIYNIESDTLLEPFALPDEVSNARRMYFLPDDNLFGWDASGGNKDPSAHIVLTDNAPSITPVFTTYVNPEYPQITASPDSNLIVISGQKEITAISLATGEVVGTLSLPAAATAMAFSPDQTLFVVATADGNLNFYGANEAVP